MNFGFCCQIACPVVGGLGIFLLGMKHMSEGMQAIAGDRLRKLIAGVTNNRFIACSVGIFITSIIQSSSVTTVMAVGLVNSGFMTLVQAIGVIIGANIGTTVTAWILVLKIGKWGLPLLGVAALTYLFSRKDRIRYTAMVLMGVGMIFFGLQLMSNGFKPLRDMPEFLEWFSRFQAHSYLGVLKCALVGCVVTAVVQSSSATIGITIGLADNGIIGFPTAVALVVGQNIGTTVTALLASIGTGTNAKRTALSHTIFNVLGVIWVLPIFHMYVQGVEWAMGVNPGTEVIVAGETSFRYMRQGIAIAHSAFNIVNTLIFLPLIPLLAKVVTILIKDKPHKEAPHLTSFDVRMLETPVIAIQRSHDEVLRMGEHVVKMLAWIRDAIVSEESDPEREKHVFNREQVLDVVQKEITEFVSSILTGSVPHNVTDEVRKQMRIADEYESISDYAVGILKLMLKLRRADIKLSPDGKREILDLHNRVADYVKMINEALRDNNRDILTKAHSQGDTITHVMKDYRHTHLGRVEKQRLSPLKSLSFVDMLQSYRKIKDHALNIAEAIAGEK